VCQTCSPPRSCLPGNASILQCYRYHLAYQEICRHEDSMRRILGNASNNPAPPPEMPLSNRKSILHAQSRASLAQQAHVRIRAPPPYHHYMYENSCGQTATDFLRCAHLPQYDQRSCDCTRHCVEMQPHRNIPPLYHVPSQHYFPSCVATLEAFPNQAHHQAPVLQLPTPLNYQMRTLHASDAMCTPVQTTTTCFVALHALPGVTKADATRQHAAKACNSGCVGGHCAEEVPTEEWLLTIDPDPPAQMAITIPKDQCTVSGASEGNLHIIACDTEEWSLSTLD